MRARSLKLHDRGQRNVSKNMIAVCFKSITFIILSGTKFITIHTLSKNVSFSLFLLIKLT